MTVRVVGSGEKSGYWDGGFFSSVQKKAAHPALSFYTPRRCNRWGTLLSGKGIMKATADNAGNRRMINPTKKLPEGVK
jgi:hypothetical protein